MQIDEKMTDIDNYCESCVALNCTKKGTAGHLPNCPKDPEQKGYMEAFRQRFNGHNKHKT